MQSTEKADLVDRILSVLHDGGAESYFGEPVTQLDHALQTAALADAAGATHALVVAALLHDIGHLLHGHAEDIADLGVDARHEDVGDRWLSLHFSRAVTEPIRLHVAAKRYLCAVEPAYIASLSAPSQQSLALQGGPMTIDEARTFEQTRWSREAALLRRWDDAAKVSGLEVPGLLHYRSRIEQLLERQFTLAVFDVAGTTVLDGDAVTECLTGALAKRMSVSRQEVLNVMGLPKPLAIRTLLSLPGRLRGEALDAAVDDTHRQFRAALIDRYRHGTLAPAEGAERVFTALRHAGVRVALDTGFSRDILDTVLERLGWTGSTAVDLSIASDEVERGRPHPDLIHRAMALTGVAEPGRVVKIGDTPADLEQGVAAGCGLVVGVTYGTHTRVELTRPGVHIIDRLPDLLSLIGVDRA